MSFYHSVVNENVYFILPDLVGVKTNNAFL